MEVVCIMSKNSLVLILVSFFIAYSGLCLHHANSQSSPVKVWVEANPPSVTDPGHIWQNYDAEANIACIGPDCKNFRQYAIAGYTEKNSSNIDCSDTDIFTYQDYSEPVSITEHSWVCGRVNYLGLKFYSDPVEFFIDKNKPTSQINPFPSPRTNAQYQLDVSWSGDDNEPVGSGIYNYTVEFNVSNAGSYDKEWTVWLYETLDDSGAFQSGLAGTSELIEGATYCFRVYAKDFAGNVEDMHTDADACVTIDREVPTCTINPLPRYINEDEYNSDPSGGFALSWTGSDNGKIIYYNISYNASGVCDTPWQELTGETLQTSYDFSATDGCTYHFQCQVADDAGNVGYSDIAYTTVDITPPSAQIIKPNTPWKTGAFNLSWEGSDETSGIKCYEISWTDKTDINGNPIGYNYIEKTGGKITKTDCSGLGDETNIMFDTSVIGVDRFNDGDKFFFSVRAQDYAGNWGEWNAYWESTTSLYNITIDLSDPYIDVSVTDQDGNPITSSVISSEDVTSININSNAYDTLSGIKSNLISYDVLSGDIRTIDSEECGPGDPYGGISECTKNLDFGKDVVIKFQVMATDRAGNTNQTKIFYVVTHPFANFMGNDVVLTIGESYIANIQVRNIQNFADTVNVYFADGSYPLAKFIDTGVGNIQNDGKYLSVRLNPDEEKTFQVDIESAMPDTQRPLNLLAFSDTIPQEELSDADSLMITILYPPSFAGIDDFAFIFLIFSSIPIYVILKRRKTI